MEDNDLVSDAMGFEVDFGDLELTEDDLQHFSVLESLAVPEAGGGTRSSDDEDLHVSSKRRRLMINSDSDTDSVENFVRNNIPTSTYSNKWLRPMARQTARVIPFTEPTGMKYPYAGAMNQANPEDFFSLLITDELFENIAEETNLFATQTLTENDTKPSSRSHHWKPTNKDEMKRFFGLILFMGLVRLPKLSDYWSTDPILGHPFPRTVMSRNRFELLLQYLHFADNDNINPNDRLGKIRYLINTLNSNFAEYYSPKEEVCVDESMIPFRGRIIFRQYNKSKRHKYGIKLFKICTNPGYTLKLQVYSGKIFEVSNTPTKVVLSLCESLLNKGHTVATDNWYTSLELAYELLKNETHLIGTLRKNRRRLPKIVTEKKLKAGEFVAQQNEDGITVLKWKDKRDVLMLSTKHDDKFIRMQVKGKTIIKPKVVLDYNKAKGSVDMSDQMTAYSSPLRKSVKLYKKLGIELILNTSVVNAMIMYTETTQKQISMVDYRKTLVEYLTSSGKEDHSREQIATRPKRLKHVLQKKPGPVKSTRRFCVQCYKDNINIMPRKEAKNKTKKVNTYCVQCSEHFCLPCFNKVHRH